MEIVTHIFRMLNLLHLIGFFVIATAMRGEAFWRVWLMRKGKVIATWLVLLKGERQRTWDTQIAVYVSVHR
ncbi:hypothetical protein K431DRAFT_31066 [Polychaeton citri CBS 116435]|uniref:Uncharacterized protein n=1 Tax=Polychaeton citri CBS 116435 TaxID=1314669 RepID=A0A9P4UP40_9PEZI|nr:hypothetical protein K431DRAFT_31066 [Polychaeton citri CBS 116435]